MCHFAVVMSGCPEEYKPFLRTVAYTLSLKEISALLSKASKYLVDILSEVTYNLCCTKEVLTEDRRKELGKFRSVIRAVVCKKQGLKVRRRLFSKKPILVKKIALLALTYE